MPLSRRLLIGGSGSFTSATRWAALTDSPDGGWTHASDPHAVHYAGVTYFAYVDGTSGNLEVRTYTHATATVGAAIVLKAALDANTHVAPSLLVRSSDHKLVAVYSQHSGASIWRRISTTSLDTDPDLGDGFAAEGALDSSLGGTQYTYPTLLQLDGETNDPIYLFYRDRQDGGASATMCYSKSTDGGATWSAQTEVFQNGTYSAYWKVTGDGNNRIDIVTSDSRNPPDAVTTKMYAFYYHNGTWRKSDGTSIGSPPFDPSDLTEVYDGGDGTGWPMDVVLGSDGYPRCSFAVVTGASSNDWRYARWTGSAWTTSTMAASDGVIEGSFASSVCLDHSDPNVAYAPVKVGSRWELYSFRTSDGGATWGTAPVTTASAADHFTPVCIRDHPNDMSVLVMYGTYTDYLNFATGIRGAR